MGEITKIQWTDHTFNPWIGCAKVAPGCQHCYAEADMDKRRHFALWGPAGTRVKTSAANWSKPKAWNKQAAAVGERRRVFCASLADVFEDWGIEPILDHRGDVIVGPDGLRRITMANCRRDLFELIDSTPNLDWLLLTKRPENIVRMWPPAWDMRPIFPGAPGKLGQPIRCLVSGKRRENVWLGTSISDQATADKAIPHLLACRDLAPVLFLSAEPLLGPINLRPLIWSQNRTANLDWVIVGGESGPQARPCNRGWVRDIVGQCAASGVPCFVKQLGATWVSDDWRLPNSAITSDMTELDQLQKYRPTHAKGGDPAEWPEDLRVREFPQIQIQ